MVGLLVGVLVVQGLGVERAPQTDAWLTLVEAGADANIAGDFRAAETLFKACAAVAQRVDPKGGRVVISNTLLAFTYLDMGDNKKAGRYKDFYLDPAGLDRAMLPVANALSRLADRYEQRAKEKDSSGLMIEAALLLRFEERLQARFLGDLDPELGDTRGYLGYVLEMAGMLPQAIESYRDAVKIGDHEAELHRRLKGGGHQAHPSSNSQMASGVLNGLDLETLKWRLAWSLIQIGVKHEKDGKQKEAQAAFEEASKIGRELAKLYGEEWPGHPYAAGRSELLARALSHLPQHHAEAALQYRRSLQTLEHQEGSSGPNVRSVAKYLIELLRNDKKEDEAKELEKKYDASASR